MPTLIRTKQNFPKLTCPMHLNRECCSAGVLLFSSMPAGCIGLQERNCLWAITSTVSKLHFALIQNNTGVQVSSKASAWQDILLTLLPQLTLPRHARALTCLTLFTQRLHVHARVYASHFNSFSPLHTCRGEDLTIHVPPTPRDGRGVVGVPRAKSISLLKKKAKSAVHVNTATRALPREVKGGAGACTPLDYSEGGGKRVEGRASSEWKTLSSPPDVFKDNKPHPLHSVLTLARRTRTRSKPPHPRHLKADTALTNMSVLSHANYHRATFPPSRIKVGSRLITQEKRGLFTSPIGGGL